MTEIFQNISNAVKKVAETAWTVAMAQPNPVESAKFLNNVTNYYSHLYTEEEIEFLKFYFNMKMEELQK